MKFARYLQDTQTPEWKKAYIDYRGLKKRIAAIRKAQQGVELTDSPGSSQDELPLHLSRQSDSHSETHSIERTPISPFSQIPEHDVVETSATSAPAVPGLTRRQSVRGRMPSFRGASIPSFRRGHDRSLSTCATNGLTQTSVNPLAPLPLQELLTRLSDLELEFFSMLDTQLDKVDSFYVAREKEMLARGKLLQEQLSELNDHRELVLKKNPKSAWPSGISATIKSKFKPDVPSHIDESVESDPEEGKEETKKVPSVKRDHSPRWNISSARSSFLNARMFGSGSSKDRDSDEEPTTNEMKEKIGKRGVVPTGDLENYLYAKKKLKKAVLEFYRGLEVLHNYRVLNITGFRKALKKFEKVTKIPAQNQYMAEKIEKSAFASDKAIRNMMKDMEDIYAAAFMRGDKKKAMKRLRGGSHVKSHHYSTFRSGLFMGVAIPALVGGLVRSFEPETRMEIPGWDGLLFIYGVFAIPVVFSLLVGLNLLVWSHSRINYTFIFELDLRTRLDYREYFEVPSILFSTLCYAFWLSFSRIGVPRVSPTVWPLAWLGLAGVIVIQPFPMLFRSSRYWLLRNFGRLLLSGTRRVEFADFWMGDQFCSLVFTLSNLYLIGCIYNDGLDENWRKCGASSSHWPLIYVLAILPLFVRLIQSIKRYADSKLITHLINGGKYASGIISYFFYYLWRHHGTNNRGALFAIWCLFNASYSIYATCWDFLMDWSLLRVHAQYPFLRQEVVYANHIPLYYFAILSNVLVRFIWVLYIPKGGPDMQLRTFIAAVLEMLRRWQWNFYRLENEHLGNMDQYRVTREVPLPYSFDDASREDDADDDSDVSSRLKKR